MNTINFNKYKNLSNDELLYLINIKFEKFNYNNDPLLSKEVNNLIFEAKKRKIKINKYQLGNKILYK